MNSSASTLFHFVAKKSWMVFVLLCLITTIVYFDIFSHSFINYDDYRIITSRIDKYDGINIKNIKDIIFNDYPREEPLIVRDLSYLVNAEIFGKSNALGYLLGNLVLHIVTAFLVYILSLHILPGQYISALIAAVIFAIHPVNVESVAWISSRKNPLFAIFLLLALFNYIKYTDKHRALYLIISAILFPLALLSKAAAICFFPIILCYRFFVKKEVILSWAEVVYFGVIFLTTLVFIRWYSGVLQEYEVIEGLVFDRDWLLFLLSTFEYITFYVSKLLVPLNLSTFYSSPAPSFVYTDISYLISSLSFISIAIYLCYLLYRNNYGNALFLIAIFVGALIPYLGFAEIDIYVADRYLYVSSAAYAIGFTWVMHLLYKKINSNVKAVNITTLGFLVILYCLMLGIRSAQATTVWKNTFSFWVNANLVSPDHIRPYRGLMSQYTKYAYDFPDDPYSVTAINNAKELGHKAFDKFCPSMKECDPEIFGVSTYLGNAYALEGDYDRSDYYYEFAFKIKPDYIIGRYRYLTDLVERKAYDKALHQFAYIEKNANPHRYATLLQVMHEIIRPKIPKSEEGQENAKNQAIK